VTTNDGGGAEALAARIRAGIDARGPLSFGDYMDLALYDPDHGFYARGGAGRRRDFITSPEVGPLFGVLVARALDRRWDRLGRPAVFGVIEAGAGPGTLARSVLAADPACGPALEYLAVESSAEQRAAHPSGVTSLPDFPSEQFECGVVLANELLDNLAFDLYDYVPGAGWHEVRVGVDGDRLVEVSVPASDAEPLGPGVMPDRAVRVPDQRAARAWLARALRMVGRGGVLVFDYVVPAFPAEPERRWLRTYRGHEHGGHPLEVPGTQDITVDVALDQLGQVAEPAAVRSQADWLRDLGIEELVEQGRRHWAAHAARPDLVAMRMRSRVNEAAALLDPGGLGAFTVIEWYVGDRRDPVPAPRRGAG